MDKCAVLVLCFCYLVRSQHVNYQTTDGQSRYETVGPDGTIYGQYSYVDPDGKVTTLKYSAGKHGFQVDGDHVPKGPPAPAPVGPAPAPAPARGPAHGSAPPRAGPPEHGGFFDESGFDFPDFNIEGLFNTQQGYEQTQPSSFGQEQYTGASSAQGRQPGPYLYD